MAGVAGRSGGSRPNTGGARPGAGAKPKPPTLFTQIQASDDPVTFLTSVMMNGEVDGRMRIDAARALLPYVSTPVAKAATGKKADKQRDAEEVGKGRFSSSPVPIGLLKKAA